MNSTLYPGPHFRKATKKLARKYPSFATDLRQLIGAVSGAPTSGTALGGGLYKIRLAMKSKGRGESGGARVVTQVELIVQHEEKHAIVDLITVYDKSEIGSIPTALLREWGEEARALREEE